MLFYPLRLQIAAFLAASRIVCFVAICGIVPQYQGK